MRCRTSDDVELMLLTARSSSSQTRESFPSSSCRAAATCMRTPTMLGPMPSCRSRLIRSHSSSRDRTSRSRACCKILGQLDGLRRRCGLPGQVSKQAVFPAAKAFLPGAGLRDQFPHHCPAVGHRDAGLRPASAPAILSKHSRLGSATQMHGNVGKLQRFGDTGRDGRKHLRRCQCVLQVLPQPRQHVVGSGCPQRGRRPRARTTDPVVLQRDPATLGHPDPPHPSPNPYRSLVRLASPAPNTSPAKPLPVATHQTSQGAAAVLSTSTDPHQTPQ
jgi:hypothetical protein